MSEYRLKAMRVWVPAALFAEARGVVAPSGAPFLPTFLARQKSRSPRRRRGETAVEVEVEVALDPKQSTLKLIPTHPGKKQTHHA
ncbi:hypothetical protein [Cupriavidus basilensis]|uniref:hypothetical protein n=1 Tax=Cupriavidus basilensis TaxID=68895 RepID=UPI001185693C|nr:hypothetical protein [Cupriavidus basilensis]